MTEEGPARSIEIKDDDAISLTIKMLKTLHRK
jgi:hypothetical protein